MTGFGSSECPRWGPLEGHWAGQRLFPKSRLGLGLWPGPCLGSPRCFLRPLFHGLPALPEGIQAPGAVSRQGKGLKPQQWHMGKTLLGWGSPKRGFRAIPELLGRAPWRQQGSGGAPWKRGGFGADPGDLSPDPSAGRAVGNTGRAGALPGQGVARRWQRWEGRERQEGRNLCWEFQSWEKRGAGVAGVAVSWQRVFIPK